MKGFGAGIVISLILSFVFVFGLIFLMPNLI